MSSDTPSSKSPPVSSPTSDRPDRLTPSEIEWLRQNAREAEKAMKEIRARLQREEAEAQAKADAEQAAAAKTDADQADADPETPTQT